MQNQAADLKTLFNMSTFLLVVLNMLTLGIFPIIWLWQKKDTVNQAVGSNLINETFLIVMAIMTALNLICVFTDMGSFFGLALGVGWMVYAYRARTILVNYAAKTLGADLRMNGVWTFFFTLFYVNYCINDLPNLVARQNLMRAA